MNQGSTYAQVHMQRVWYDFKEVDVELRREFTATCMLTSSLCAAVYSLAVCPCGCPVFHAHVENFCVGAVSPQAEKGRICLVEAHQVCQHLPVATQIIIKIDPILCVAPRL